MSTIKPTAEVIIRRNPSSGIRRKGEADLETIKAIANACEAEATRAGILHLVD